MQDFESQVPIIRDGWDCLVFRRSGEFVTIPDEVMLDELIRPPLPYKILHLLSIYKTSQQILEDVFKILVSEQKPPSWKLITKTLKGTNSKRLYIASSQNAYRLKPSFDLESQIVLQRYSNTAIDYIHRGFSFPSEFDRRVKKICDNHGYCFETYQFHQTVQRYCSFMIPYPYRNRFDREDSPHILLNKPIDFYGEKERRICDREIASERMIMERFSLYHYSTAFTNKISLNIDPDEKEILDSSLFVSTDNLYTNARKIARHQRTQRKEQKAIIESQNELLCSSLELHQCVFCYRFSFVELPPQGNDFKQHCDRDECKKAYERWKKHLNRLKIPLKRGEIDG
jgi:hypothetical protein